MEKKRQRSRAEGVALVERFETSGLSQKAFAEQEQFPRHQLQYWIRTLKDPRPIQSEQRAEQPEMRFVQVVEKSTTDGSVAVSIEFGDLVTIKFDQLPSSSFLVELVHKLGVQPSC